MCKINENFEVSKWKELVWATIAVILIWDLLQEGDKQVYAKKKRREYSRTIKKMQWCAGEEEKSSRQRWGYG